MQIRKRRFQLLEILIALSLIVACAVPLLQTFVQMHIEQKEENRAVQANKLMRDIHAGLTEELYAHQIPWEEIERQELVQIEDDSLAKRAKELNFRASYQFKLYAVKKTKQINFYLFKLHIYMRDISDPKNVIETYYNEYVRVQV